MTVANGIHWPKSLFTERNPHAMAMFQSLFNDPRTQAGMIFGHYLAGNAVEVTKPFNEVAADFLEDWAKQLRPEPKESE